VRMDEVSTLRLNRLMLAPAGWTKCSFEAQTSKAPGAGVYADAIAIEFLIGPTWTPAVDLLPKGHLWGSGKSLFRVDQFQSRPTHIRITAGEFVDRFSIYKVRSTAHPYCDLFGLNQIGAHTLLKYVWVWAPSLSQMVLDCNCPTTVMEDPNGIRGHRLTIGWWQQQHRGEAFANWWMTGAKDTVVATFFNTTKTWAVPGVYPPLSFARTACPEP
jgi:hypothetical protein